MTYKAISLFTGAGGMDVGFTSAGFDVVWANEFDKHAAATYNRNNPSVPMAVGDINQLMNDIPKRTVDCVFGGPPCQAFSVAGKMDPNDPRAQLVFSFLKVVERTRPSCFVMENVKALLTLSKFQNVRQELVRAAQALGYSTTFLLLNAKDFGVPQSRERMFLIGFDSSVRGTISQQMMNSLKQEENPAKSVFLKLGKGGTEQNPITCRAKITLAESPVLRRSPYAGMLFNGLGRPINLEAPSNTLPASMGGNKTPIVDEGYLFDGSPNWVEHYHQQIIGKTQVPRFADAPQQLRRITLREAALLQTFPAEYEFVGPVSAQYCQIGNAVPCLLAQAVANAVRRILDGELLEDRASQTELLLTA